MKHRSAILFGDAALVFISYCAVTALRRWYDITPSFALKHAGMFGMMTLLWIWTLHLCGLYEMRHIERPRQGAIFVSAVASFTISAVVFYFLSGMFDIPAPKTILLLGSVLAWALLEFWRTWWSRRQAIEGRDQNDEENMVWDESLDPKAWANGYQERLRRTVFSGAPVFSPVASHARLTGKIPLDKIDPRWVVERVLAGPGLRLGYLVSKRLTDLILLVVLSLPAVFGAAFLAAWIKVFLRGPVLYNQQRVGRAGRLFSLYKFRTMREVADIFETNPLQERVTAASDPRVPVALRWVRRMHLDELPQLINIARGDMSFVGPRPEQEKINLGLESAIPYYWVRHTVTPGLTGWAQVNMGYAETRDDARERFAFDLYYLSHGGFWLDLAIIIRTLRSVLFADGR